MVAESSLSERSCARGIRTTPWRRSAAGLDGGAAVGFGEGRVLFEKKRKTSQAGLVEPHVSHADN